MSNIETIILPFFSQNWKEVVKYIIDINNSYDQVKNIFDIITIFRRIKNIYEGLNSLELSNSFIGLGLYLENCDNVKLQHFINTHLRSILYYICMIEELFDQDICTLSYINCSLQISLAAVKSLAACGLICLLPHRNVNIGRNNMEYQMVNFNFDDLVYQGISFGSKRHIDMFDKILQCYSNYSEEKLYKEMNEFISFSLVQTESSHFILNESITSWPVILTSNLFTNRTKTTIIENIWPMCFEDIHPSKFTSHLKFNTEYSPNFVCPLIIIILPILTIGSPDVLSSNIIKIDFNDIHHTLYRILPIDPWNPDPQFTLEYIENNTVNCILAFQCLIKKYQSNGSQFATNFMDSVIEDAIHRLNLVDSREIFTSIKSPSNITDSGRIGRASLSNIIFKTKKPRDPSNSSNSSSSRSARHSYSTSSSSRSGSLQLSSFSSRRSSSISANKEIDSCANAIADKANFTSHSFHPIILEESNLQADDDENLLMGHRTFQNLFMITDCSTTFNDLMSAPISDSIKFSLSKDYLNMIAKKSTQNYLKNRRNSSPALGSSLSKDPNKVSYEISKLKIKHGIRCCEEDASNNFLSNMKWSRSNNNGRRQSLPCHLQWVYQLPLTDSIKLSLSQSQMFATDSQHDIDPKNSAVTNWSQSFVEDCLTEISQVTLKRIISYANDILLNILPNELEIENQVELRKEILNCRSRSNVNQNTDQIYYNDFGDQTESIVLDKTLEDNDLATFDKELCFSTFFDDEALQYFRDFSNINSSNDVLNENFHVEVNKKKTISDNSSLSTNKNMSLNQPLIEYVNQLTRGIIVDAIVQETDSSGLSSSAVFNQYADDISVDIIANALAELTFKEETEIKYVPPIYINILPYNYDNELGMLIQILSACITQYHLGHSIILVCECDRNKNITEILEIINQNRLTPFHVYNIMVQYFTKENLREKINLKDFILNCV